MKPGFAKQLEQAAQEGTSSTPHPAASTNPAAEVQQGPAKQPTQPAEIPSGNSDVGETVLPPSAEHAAAPS